MSIVYDYADIAQRMADPNQVRVREVDSLHWTAEEVAAMKMRNTKVVPVHRLPSYHGVPIRKIDVLPDIVSPGDVNDAARKWFVARKGIDRMEPAVDMSRTVYSADFNQAARDLLKEWWGDKCATELVGNQIRQMLK